MEEKKEKKKISKVYIVIFTLAIVSAILGVFDLKANAAELTEEIPYLNVTYSNYWNENYPYSVPDGYIYPDFDGHFQTYELDNTRLYALMRTPYTSSDGTIICYYYSLYNGDGVGYFTNNEQPCSYVPTTYNQYKYVKNGTDTFNDTVTYSTSDSTFTVYVAPELEVNNSRIIDSTFETNIPIFEDNNAMTTYLKTGVLEGNIIDYSSFDIDDEMPVVQNLNFDRIENVSNNGVNNIKTITDYIRFEPNFDYKLLIMVCPSVYSTIGDNDFVPKFDLYEYEKWVVMETSDVGLKEINCELGQFKIPTNSTDCIISSNYKSYYESICYELSDTGQLVFKPTMGYRLAYVDETSGIIGPSTYIMPNYYDNLDPDDETYSNFVLYSDGTHSSEKIMNLETWQQEEGTTIDSIKDSIDYVNDKLSDYNSANSNVNVQEASNWLKTVANFISGTPSVVGSVLSFLPQPILYGLYICIFLGVIASGYAIIRALI